MRICLVTPAAKGSLNGNRITAVRWGKVLQQLGHQVHIDTGDPGQRFDLMVAIHAWRSAQAVQAYRRRQPGAPLVVLLAGTDIYKFSHSDPEVTLNTMAMADRLVGLHDRVHLDIPSEFGSRLRIIRQASLPLSAPRSPLKRNFQVCVVGHLREEKDSLRSAYAARQMRASSRLRVVHLGAAHTEQWAEDARAEQVTNPRYQWRGEVSRGAVRKAFSTSHAMVISSIMEGGANVVSEAMVAGLPVIASDISGNRGLLGDDHQGYFLARNEDALATLLKRAESTPGFLQELAETASLKAHQFTPSAELASWKALLEEIA